MFPFTEASSDEALIRAKQDFIFFFLEMNTDIFVDATFIYPIIVGLRSIFNKYLISIHKHCHLQKILLMLI